jgi:uncharacterized membrane protein YcfT
VDYAKGWSIVLVVSMHSALGVGLALDKIGWLHPIVAFAKPFRMPDFFLVAGLFLGRAIDWPLRAYLDRKAVHFVYFFVLWTFIILLAKAGELGLTEPRDFLLNFLLALVEPFSSLWFVQLLPVLFVAVRLARDIPPIAQIAAAIVLHLAAARYPDGGLYAMGSNMSGLMTVDTFSLFLIYFLIGHHARAAIFAFAAWVSHRQVWAIVGLALWAVVQAFAVSIGLTEIPGLTLVFGLLGGLAVVATASLMSSASIARWLAYCGRRSLPIYLAFALPMAATRRLLVRTEIVSDPGWAAFIVTFVAIVASLGLEAAVRSTWFSFLFARPTWARLRSADRGIGRQPVTPN